MATHDYVIDNSTGANVRADINLVLQAILTNNSSSSAPSTTAAYMWWADTTNGVLKIRNSSNNDWVELLQLDGTLTLEDGSASTPALAFRDDLNTGIFSSAADNFDISTGGTVRLNVNGNITKISDILDVVTIRRQVQNSGLVISGGNATNDGANISLFGSTHSSQANNIEFRAGGTNTMKLDSSGRLLIGSTTADDSAQMLKVARTSGTARLAIQAANDGSSQLDFADVADADVGRIQYDHSSNFMALFTDNSERMRIQQDGKVGIGTTSPRSLLDLGTGTDAATISNTAADYQLGLHAAQSTGGDIGRNIGFIAASGGTVTAAINSVDEGGSDQTGLVFATGNSSSIAERVRIDQNGNVGIGTTSPTSAGGYDKFVQISDNNSASVAISRSASGTAHTLELGVFSGASLIESTGATSLRFKINSSESMRIQSTGVLNIGSTTGSSLPDRLLQIGSTSRSATFIELRTSTSGSSGIVFSDGTANDNTGFRGTIEYFHNTDIMLFKTAASERIRLDSSGNLLVGRTSSGNTGNGHTIRGGDSVILSRNATGETLQVCRNNSNGDLIQFRTGDVGTNASVCGEIVRTGSSSVAYQTSSDYRLKENEVAISDGITRLKLLKPYRFNFKSEPSKTVDGFYAHEVTPAVPEAIFGEKDDPNRMQGIDQSKLVPLLTAALQEAIVKIEVLETKVAALEAA